MRAVDATGTDRRGYFDAARALAAFMVIAVHTQQNFAATTPLVMTVAQMGQLGVQLFFVVSAFLIFDSLERLKHKGGSLLEYFFHRFLRVAPLYYVAIIGWTIVTRMAESRPAWGFGAAQTGAYTWPNILSNVLLIHGLIPSANNSIVGGGWSVGTEFLFYLLAPVLFEWRKRPWRIACAAAICMPFVSVAVNYLQPDLEQPRYVIDNSFLYFSIINQLPVFVVGMLLYCFRDAAFRMSAPVATAGMAIFAVATCWIWQRHFSGELTFFFVPLLSAISFAFLLVLLKRAPKIPSTISVVGQRSFSIYLLSAPTILILKNICHSLGTVLSFPTALLIVTISVCTCASVTYHLIEKPFINFAKRMFARSDASMDRRFSADPQR